MICTLFTAGFWRDQACRYLFDSIITNYNASDVFALGVLVLLFGPPEITLSNSLLFQDNCISFS